MTQYLLIDGSYYCFYRYYALHRWWSFAKQDDELGENPYNNKEFVDKFRKVFITKIHECIKKLKLTNPTVIVAKDCHRCNIWRHDIYNEYKATRDNDNTFMGGPFFKLAYDSLFSEAGIEKIIHHPKLEADDCISMYTNCIINDSSKENEVYIIASDMDYLQLVKPRVNIYNLNYKKLTDSKSCLGDPKKDLFCKIIIGDKSDNIPGVFSKCGIKTACKYYENPELLQQRVTKDEQNGNTEIRSSIIRNKKLIDFNEIPQHLQTEFWETNNYT